MRRKIWITFGGILLLTILSGLIVVPKGPDIGSGDSLKEIKLLLGLDLRGGAQLVYSADVSAVPSGDEQEAVDGVRDVIERRVNAFGVSEPVVQTSNVSGSWRILVELPGVTDVEQAIQQIGETPLLEFREQEEVVLSDEEKQAIDEFNSTQRQKAGDVLAEATKPGADFGALADTYSEDPGNTDPTTQEQKGGDLGFVGRGVFVPEFEEQIFDILKPGEVTQNLVETQFGYHIIRKEEQRTTDDQGNAVDEVRSRHILFMKQSADSQSGQQYVATGLTGTQLKQSQVAFDQTTGTPYISLQFNDEGSKLFEEITERNVGKPVGIFLDGSVISSPVVQQKITGGQASIEGGFTLEEAKELVRRLNAGALPIPVTLESQQTIGATLGEESVERSLFAGVLGMVVVAVFMIAYYRLPGLLAIFSLTIYCGIVLAIFKLLPVTMTLAGVAGFILSVGMAVDANVLIFERTKEELRAGKPVPVAIEEGFKRAWLSIRDSNASSLISVFILGWLGTSIIKGFAITLGIGIVVSMFTAITITRTFIRLIAGEWLHTRPWLFGIGSHEVRRHDHV